MDSNAIVCSSMTEPCPGMEFESHENAYSFYRDYAKTMGFGTAKLSSRRSRASKEFIDAKFSCTRYGNKQQSDDAINPRPSPKIGCKASMHVKRKQNGKWYVYSFVKDHNHELLPSQVHLFRSHRNTDLLKNDVRIRRRKNLAAMSKMFSAYQNVDCLESYVKNQHDKGRTLVLESGDAQILLELFMHMQEENPKFFYAVDLNEEHQLRNVFWVDGKGMEDYVRFGDVVSFDTTYFTNKYKLPLVLFIGVNHHIQPTLLGCALIADETVNTFSWLIQTWYIAMGERAPQVMLTDQNTNIKAVIEAVLPGTRHYFCLWYILQKIPKNLEFLSMWHEGFMEEFKNCVFKSWTKEQFEKRWQKLLDGFSLREVEWMQYLYDDRAYWVPSFARDVSFAGLCTFSRMESLNSFFDKYVKIETSLTEFIERYKDILEDRYEEEAKANFDAWHDTPELKSPSPFEKQVSLVYTHEIFKKFQMEVLGAAACHLKKETEDATTTTYTVKDIEDGQNYVVECSHSNSDIYCSCRSFEYKGFLCRHAIIVLQMSGVFSIPSKYVLQRWTNTATSRNPINEKLDEVQCKVRRFNDLCRRAIILGEEGSLSQESYDIALSAINEALKQCATVSRSNSAENDVRPDNSGILVFGIEEDNQCSSSLAVENSPDLKVINAKKNPKRAGSSKEPAANEISKNGKVSQPLDANAGSQDDFNQLELSDMRPIQLHGISPTQLHNMVPTLLHNVTPTQFHSMTSAHLHESLHPR
ncbi:protein FAR1-RELATED SEQUENCE 4 [Cucurbita pepo subsp. pepo]|uniref:protein FAR1-RELATED SEQUENCE 4 n=1 Tax=Cucurbita pepo subsp. pepo TaxID=3664 RepID=UPI000C9D4606|nr:protein FAR1-RELATED SEQUENCE 4 [Cucurbita pepo subsp. pepo]XP_023517945.1 protein FAR1-RELATED SEQUENCE 4 [Cucurbita pepo subsp. pepo]XP_023517946.1 protein FAR1-RELATED SEQUENCE 4 [Cucurbita pepo subsp. pepo]XP_023517947.1 protein FAR1-RELATED SEQUENCE 4 [Cucurbita pepo subsp. pepo]